MLAPEVQELASRVAAHARRGRARLNLSQEKFAERAGFNARYYRRIEKAEVDSSLTTLYRLARALGITPLQLLRPTAAIPPKAGRPRKKKTTSGAR